MIWFFSYAALCTVAMTLWWKRKFGLLSIGDFMCTVCSAWLVVPVWLILKAFDWIIQHPFWQRRIW